MEICTRTIAIHDWNSKPLLSKPWFFSKVGMFLIGVGPSCVKFLALGPLQFAICPWHLAIAHCNWHLAIGPWPLAFAISNLTLTPCNLQRAMGTFRIETQVFWFLLLSNHVASFWVKRNLPRSPKNSITWMQWPLLIRKPIAYKPEIDPRHVRTEVGLNQAHLNSCQNSAFLWFGDFVLMLDLAFVCLYHTFSIFHF